MSLVCCIHEVEKEGLTADLMDMVCLALITNQHRGVCHV